MNEGINTNTSNLKGNKQGIVKRKAPNKRANHTSERTSKTTAKTSQNSQEKRNNQNEGRNTPNRDQKKKYIKSTKSKSCFF